MKLLLILASSLFLFGCASAKVTQQAAPIQANLLTKCQALSKHDGTTGGMVLRTMTRWASEYNECAARHNGLVDAIKGDL